MPGFCFTSAAEACCCMMWRTSSISPTSCARDTNTVFDVSGQRRPVFVPSRKHSRPDSTSSAPSEYGSLSWHHNGHIHDPVHAISLLHVHRFLDLLNHGNLSLYGDMCVMNSIKRLNLRNFDCLLGCRTEWFLMLPHGWHIHHSVDVLALWDLNGFLYLLDRGDLFMRHHGHVHSSLDGPLLDSFLRGERHHFSTIHSEKRFWGTCTISSTTVDTGTSTICSTVCC